ncbi:PRA1 family protein-domain-containing protein [Gamsiella multidivaricata]|uniref:PRA1 family protein-domain-containing protein n=1 Tax=Gamsiella multidivaricata TaxID=101098 RepID=UPI00221ED74D|nr:PRA1 family protein-domain-containing protein [Gamsiella multidivaricata]KAI7822938.1 PRA1 family protein-domain-containing protein [Gamsiella multidivaricata]
MAAPAYTPVGTNPFTGGFPSDEASAAVSSASAFGLGYLRKFREERLSSLRPVSEFFDKNRFSMPTSFSNVTSRFNYNLNYFQGNYFLMFLAITIYSLITNFMLLFSVVFVFGGMHFLQRVPPEGITIGQSRFQASQLKMGLIIISVILFFLSSTVGTVFWIVGAGAFFILGHAAVMQEGVEGDFVAIV